MPGLILIDMIFRLFNLKDITGIAVSDKETVAAIQSVHERFGRLLMDRNPLYASFPQQDRHLIFLPGPA